MSDVVGGANAYWPKRDSDERCMAGVPRSRPTEAAERGRGRRGTCRRGLGGDECRAREAAERASEAEERAVEAGREAKERADHARQVSERGRARMAEVDRETSRHVKQRVAEAEGRPRTGGA